MNALHIGWPQGITLALMLIGMGRAMARFGEVKKDDTYDIVDVLIGPALTFGLLYLGGFFS